MMLEWAFLTIWGVGILILFKGKKETLLRKRLEDLKSQSQAKVHQNSLLKKRRVQKMEREIARDMAFLRNLLLLGSGSVLSVDYVLTRLAFREGPLKPAYLAMLSHQRLNRKQKALEAFSSYVQVPMARELAGLLLQWDELESKVISEILTSHQKTLRDIRMTQQTRRDETMSDLIYLPAVFNVLIICVNFIYISYYINQQEVFRLLFSP
jgi:hypothetical protein